MVPHKAGDRCTLQYRHDKLSHGCRNIHVFGFYTGSRETRAQRKKTLTLCFGEPSQKEPSSEVQQDVHSFFAVVSTDLKLVSD